jgi:hypothetical protein
MNAKEFLDLQDAYRGVYESYLEPNLEKREKNNKEAIEDMKKTKAHRDMVAAVRKKFDEEVETDLLTQVLEYLVAEGYADTNENALAIMANMSEGWKEEILDEAAADQSDKQIDKGVKTTYKAQNVLDNQHQGRSRGLNRLPANEKKDKTKRMQSRLKTRRDDLFGERNKREDESRAELKKKYGL